MFDFHLSNDNTTKVYYLPVEELNIVLNKEISHTGFPNKDNNYEQSAILVDTGRANEVITIKGKTFRALKRINFNDLEYALPGFNELDDAIKNWWRDITDHLSGVGMPRLYDTISTYWLGTFGKCQLTVVSKEPETLRFSIVFNAVRKVS